MRKLVQLLTIFISSLVHSQPFQGWSEPVRLTDSASYNTNPVIAVTPEYYEDNLLMFYEKQFTPESPKQIWMRKISEPMGEETAILANDAVVYRNPQIIGFSYLVFESNLNGNFDLFGIKFDEYGNFESTISINKLRW